MLALPQQPAFSPYCGATQTLPLEVSSLPGQLWFLVTPLWVVIGNGVLQIIIGRWGVGGDYKLYTCNYCYYNTIVILNVFTHTLC